MSRASEERVVRLKEELLAAGVDAFLAHDPITMGYLHGFEEHAGERFMTLAFSPKGQVRLIAPALSESQARRSGIEDVRIWKDGEDPQIHFQQLAEDWGLRTAIIGVDPTLPARLLLQMQNILPAALFRDGESLVSALMLVKQADEIELMQRAGKIADDAFAAIQPLLRVGQTELQVAQMLRDLMAEQGGTPTFAIVAAGPNAAEPHHLPDHTPIKDGEVLLLDFGCEVEGYQSDITRVCALGTPSDRAFEIYDIVYRAYEAGLNVVKPGVPASQVDAAARQVIIDAGHGPAFFHRTGHGIGRNIHEHPYISAANDEPLATGNCFSIEPGIYYEGDLGIRLETIVSVSEDSFLNLNQLPNRTLIFGLG